MPLSNTEINRIADDIVSSSVRVWLHTGDPGANGTANRTNSGGGSYESGVLVAASGWSSASSGVVDNSSAVDFGEASADVGTVTHYSLIRETGSAFIGDGTLPNTTIENGDSFEINAGSIDITVSST